MVTMDAYGYHQGNNPGNGDQYLGTDDDEDLLDRKDILADSAGNFDNSGSYGNTYGNNSYVSQFQQQQHQEVGSTSSSSNINNNHQHHHPFYDGMPFNNMMHTSDIKPIISDIPPLVPPTYLQPPTPYSYNNDYQNYVGPSTSRDSNPFQHQSYPHTYPYSNNKSWYNQVKSEQMANLLNR